jgi:hypothetical protein
MLRGARRGVGEWKLLFLWRCSAETERIRRVGRGRLRRPRARRDNASERRWNVPARMAGSGEMSDHSFQEGRAARGGGAAAPLKWYFATNEEGARGVNGMHARLAVASALRNTRLRPHLITTGFRNGFTEWMEARGVTIIEGSQPLAEAIHAAAAAGNYHTRFLGHWLRCEIPALETEDDFVLYTDTDVVFLRDVTLPDPPPRYMACAPEFKMEGANYFNSGVMFLNVANMRETLPGFLEMARQQIGAFRSDRQHNDQVAFNTYYRDVWTPMDLGYNWKPYWGDPAAATILHFHGPKLPGVRSMFTPGLRWEENYWRSVGTLVASNPDGYRKSVEAVLPFLDELEPADRNVITEVRSRLAEPFPMPEEFLRMSIFDTRYRFDPAIPYLREAE